MAESDAHLTLKHHVAHWLHEEGWVAVGDEVSLGVGGYRADVAAWTDRLVGRLGTVVKCAPRTTIVECKVSRSDFLRCGGHGVRLLDRRAALTRRLASESPPHSRRRRAVSHGPTLFDGHDAPVSGQRLAIRQARLELRAIERRLHGSHKFAKMAWWRLADALWVAAPVGMIRPAELPQGWGLLEWSVRTGIRIRTRVHGVRSEERHRSRILRGVACSGTRRCWRKRGRLAAW